MENLKKIIIDNKGHQAPQRPDPEQQVKNYFRVYYRPKKTHKVAVDYPTAKSYIKTFFRKSLIYAEFGAIKKGTELHILKEAHGKKIFPMSDEKSQVIDDLSRYFSGFEGNLDLNKGIYLVGDFGSGKTSFMHVFHHFLKCFKAPQRFQIIGSEEVAELARTKPEQLRKFYAKNLCFDDLGHDAFLVKNYGNEILPFDQILSHRYRAFVEKGLITHFTANFFIKENDPEINSLADFLSPKIIDRLMEMVQVVELPGKSLRSNIEYLNQ